MIYNDSVFFNQNTNMEKIHSHIVQQYLLLFVLISIVTGCTVDSPRSASGSSVFKMNLSTEPPTLDWSLATDGVSISVIQNLMEGLTQFDDQLRPQPAVAKRWTVSPDGKTYTFYLREDIYWTDGKPVTAYDFEYSWKRLLNPKTAAEYAYFLYDIQNAFEYNSGKITDPDKVGVRASGPSMLRVDLKKPIVFFPSIAAFTGTYPQRKDLIEKYGDRWTEPGHLATN